MLKQIRNPLALAACVLLVIVVEVGRSLVLLVGFQARWVAPVTMIFTVATGYFFHKFWAAAPDQAMLEHIMFFKNMEIAGGIYWSWVLAPSQVLD